MNAAAHALTSARRTTLERLADPHTLRLLLYIGAAMLVVGVVIWLRDILYLKLREPVVQAALLAFGTASITVMGWMMMLRTRLRQTGRALTLTGSLLVPVNFWFLASSGLIASQGRTWIVCALCTMLYAATATLLRERVYVYLASIAAIATFWTMIYRLDRDAISLYPLTLTVMSLVLVHTSIALPVLNSADADSEVARSRWSPLVAIWRDPLVHVALCFAPFATFLYMPLRLAGPTSFTESFLRFRSSEYDPGVAMLLFAALAYVTWLTGTYVFPKLRRVLLTAGIISILCIEIIVLDALRISGPTNILVLALTACLVMGFAQMTASDVFKAALRGAGLILLAALASLVYPVLSTAAHSAITHSLILVALALAYATSGETDSGQSTDAFPVRSFVAYAATTIVALQAANLLRPGDSSLLSPFAALATFGVISMGAGIQRSTRADLVRAGLCSMVLAWVLCGLYLGMEPLSEAEFYTTPIGILITLTGFLATLPRSSGQRRDAAFLLWTGAVVISAPLFAQAARFRLVLGVPAAGRDLATLCASLALILFGVVRRVKAPLLVGAVSLAMELVALTATSVDWLQIPLKIYLTTVGALILLCWGLLEFRREQLLMIRERLKEKRSGARERLGEWK